MTLVDASGKVTSGGERYFAAFPEQRPRKGRLDPDQRPITRGRTQFARASNGAMVELRHYDPKGMRWIYTKQGKQFFDNHTRRGENGALEKMNHLSSRGEAETGHLKISHRNPD